jgi:hypothetical protein
VTKVVAPGTPTALPPISLFVEIHRRPFLR